MSVSELDKLKRKRTTLKGLCTKVMNSINAKFDESGEDLNLQDLESLMQRLNIKENEIFDVEAQIESIIDDLDELEKELESRQEYRDQIIHVKIQLMNKIEQSKAPSVQRNVEIDQNGLRNERRQNNRTEKSTFVKLPKISIPVFEGSPDHWTEFWSQYSATVHENSTLSNVEKFVYLRSFLKPPALTAIAGFDLSDKNYDSAIETLKSRFGKKDIVIRYKIDALLNLSPVKSANQIKELRALHDALDINIKSLENLGVDLKSYGNLLFPIVTKLIPTSIMIEYNKMKSENDEWDVRDLLDHLKLEVQTREKTFLFLKRETETHNTGHKNPNLRLQNRPSVNNEDYYKRSNSGYRNFNTPQKTSAFKVTVSKCLFCPDAANDHESEMCKLNLEDKRLSLRKQGICYLCCKKGKHVAKFCLSGIKCEKCSGNHNSLICYKQNSESQKKYENSNNRQIETPQIKENASEKNNHENENSILSYKCSVQNLNKNNEIYLQTCFAKIKNNLSNNTKTCVILYDSASQRNFINKSLAEELKLPVVKNEMLIIYPFSCDQPQQKEYSVVSFELSNLENPKEKCLIEALVVEQISFTKLRVAADVNKILSNKQNHNKSFSTMNLQTPDVLIGASLYWQLHKCKRKINRSLYAVNTLLGWTISGNNSEVHPCNLDTSVLKIECCDANLLDQNCRWVNNELNCTAEDLKLLWTLDSIGICEDKMLSVKDQEIIKNFEKQLEFKEGRYFTRLLWNDECSNNLGNNFQNAKRQFDSLRNRLEKDKWVFKEYKQIINDQKSLGIVEECNRTEKEYFAPHREVIRKDKQTTKVRMVFNCSSKTSGNKSLNDCLLKGPSLTPHILDVINKFRMFKVAFTADIEKAFLMIGINETDRNFLKFLWFGDETHDYKIMRMGRVPFGCTSSSFSLTATIKRHIRDYKEKYPDTYEMLNSALFVDDLVYGSSTVEKAYELTKNARNVLNDAGMKLRKFNTNSDKLKDLWNKNGYSSEITNDRVVSILGIVWNKTTDKLGIELKSIVENLDISVCTKRYVLHTAAKFFDPIGIISPFLIRIKCLLQRIWQRGIEWDHALPEDIKKDWVKWCFEIQDLLELRVDRCHFPRIDFENSQIDLHIFSDASPLAYGCVAYFKIINNEGECFVSMVMSKARVAPLKKLTLPRLELMGAVLAARIGKYICDVFKEIDVNKNFFWTDSSIVLHWLKGSTKEWKPFVKNRVVEIQNNSEPENWAYCSTKENPADLVTRGVSAKVLINNDFWFRGPKWLSEVDGRSSELDKGVETSHVIEERRKTPEKIIQFICPIETVEPILNLDNYSNIIKVLRITAWVKRFLNNVNPKNEVKRGPLSVEEINTAQRFWIKLTQEFSFPDELTCLKNAETIPKNSELIEFSPFLDTERIMRIGGRLGKSKFSFNEKHPILMPSKGKFTELLIRHAHEKVFHFGVNDTLVQLREQFWVIKGRQAVKGVLRKCTVCRKFNSRSGDQIIAPLPEDRIQEQKPFSIIGLDFAGPIFVRNSAIKHYILLCTCAVTRSVHLEVVDNLSTETFLMAFRRLVARRGLCHTVYSDNAKTFHRAEKELRGIWKIISHQDVINYFSSNGIKWKFIIEMSPWWGGFYERLIRSIKTALRKVVGKTTLTADQLHTVLTEIEATINSRPLTYVFSDSREPTPITPAHFLVGQRLTALPMVHIKTSSFPATSKEYIKRYNYRERLLQQFWTRWKTEYLLQLKSALTNRPSRVFEFSVGDVVLISDTKLPRHLWKLGLVTEVYTGRDGKIRSCQLKTASGIVKRPFQLLYPLELV